jgi:hypothetical protein
MAGTLPSYLAYKELHGEPAINPFVNVESIQLQCYPPVDDIWRAIGLPLMVEKLLQNIVADFSSQRVCAGFH